MKSPQSAASSDSEEADSGDEGAGTGARGDNHKRVFHNRKTSVLSASSRVLSVGLHSLFLWFTIHLHFFMFHIRTIC